MQFDLVNGNQVMSSQTEFPPSQVSASAPEPIEFQSIPEHPPVSPEKVRERRLIATTLIIVIGITLFAIVQTVGPDAMRQVRRLTSHSNSQPLASIMRPELELEPPTVDRALALAADSQISPPRRRLAAPPIPTEIPEPQQVEAPRSVVSVPPLPDPIAASMPPTPALEPVDLTTELLATAAELVNQSWQDFAYPVSWAVSETSRSRMIYNNHRNRLLKAIAHPKLSSLSLEMARKDYAAAREQFAEDPRLDYTFGLVLWKHGQLVEAIEMFQIAGRLEGEPFLPAALAVAWGRFQNHDDQRGLDQLQHIARRLATCHNPYPTEAQKEQAALTIGRSIGYLSKSDRVPELAENVRLTGLNIEKRLPEPLRRAFENGRAQVGQRESELLQLIDLPRDGLLAAHQQQHDDLQTQIATLRAEMRDSRNEVTRTHHSHVEKIADVLKEALDVRSQLDKLQPSMKKLRESLIKLSKPQPHVEVKTMPSHFHLIVGQGGQSQLVQNNATQTVLMQETATERAKRISQLNQVREDLKKIEEDLTKLRTQQQDLVSRRHEEDQQHKRNEAGARQLRVSRLQEQRELEHKLQTLNKALRRAMTLREGIDNITAYIPWNVEVEGEALWRALTAKPTASRSSK